jgi:ADP-ribosyl-[dinitrogen reductase] hydrolase
MTEYRLDPSKMTERDRYRGCLVGLAVGDALGTTVEFKPPGSFPPVVDMVGGGHFSLQPGQWTDDTSMALCLAESLLECGGFDPRDQLQRYVRWYRTGYLSSTGRCFDIGNTTRRALETFERSGDPHAAPADAQSAGNGSLMRLAPVPMFYSADLDAAVARSAESSRTTHQAQECLDACRLLGGLIALALRGASKEELLNTEPPALAAIWRDQPLSPRIKEVAAGSFRQKSPPEIRGSGHVVRTLEASLWALHHTHSFRDGALLAVNLGEDADTTAAVYGQLAGALFGLSGIPNAWIERLAMRETILLYAEKLCDKASGGNLG